MAERTKDYYRALGVSESASPDEIKKAYRRLAKKYHPDATGGDKAKEATFKEVTEAYETLGDEKKRAEYDQLRKLGAFDPRTGFPGGGFPGGAGGRINIDLNDLFTRTGRTRTTTTSSSSSARSRVEAEPRESFGDIMSDLFGGLGFGRGEGEVPTSRDVALHAEVDFVTAALGGDHTVMTPAGRVTVRVPPGIDDGQTIRVPGKGEPAQGRRPAGDLLIEVKVRPHPQLRRKGADLEVDVPVPVDVAVLGGKAEVPTLEGKVEVNVPAGTSSGVKLRLRGKGVPRRDPAHPSSGVGPRGDLYAVIQIAVPKDLSPRARELMAEFAKVTKR